MPPNVRFPDTVKSSVNVLLTTAVLVGSIVVLVGSIVVLVVVLVIFFSLTKLCFSVGLIIGFLIKNRLIGLFCELTIKFFFLL